ncbi:DUF2634 domain-containing protein [Paenibacillus sp. CFBP13512]|uniref:DUF2634 domain-containing protein n=1 Tax=Paenibacillus sp. CFBP13512 TaxID=2184007 RepID=UPI0010C12CBF|nr:DUF2634 domain-containing protein [Paenibacillus sp. CFBP13512]TKJ93314.1 DUF2634 domain-containing protein [Paenibacillus sp. CFBP13512]
MIPIGLQLPPEQAIDTETVTMPSLTYQVGWERGVITGMIDGLDSIRQAVLKILNTERYQYLIYSEDYGTEWQQILGQDHLFVRAEIQRMITEALLQDDRIEQIVDFQTYWTSGEDIRVSFTVQTRYGSFQINKEVS